MSTATTQDTPTGGTVTSLWAEVPVEPDPQEARRWMLEELSKSEYQEATPTLFDELTSRFFEWLLGLRFDGGGNLPDLTGLFITLLVVGLLVAAWFIFGRPALNRRTRTPAELFGETDTRTADDLRRDAQRHAAAGRWSDAIADLFRSIARSLDERTLVTMLPGTTAQEFALRASAIFLDHGDALIHAADLFDGVRYLDRPGTQHDYRAIADLEADIRTSRPRLDAALTTTAPDATGGVSA